MGRCPEAPAAHRSLTRRPDLKAFEVLSRMQLLSADSPIPALAVPCGKTQSLEPPPDGARVTPQLLPNVSQRVTVRVERLRSLDLLRRERATAKRYPATFEQAGDGLTMDLESFGEFGDRGSVFVTRGELRDCVGRQPPLDLQPSSQNGRWRIRIARFGGPRVYLP